VAIKSLMFISNFQVYSICWGLCPCGYDYSPLEMHCFSAYFLGLPYVFWLDRSEIYVVIYMSNLSLTLKVKRKSKEPQVLKRNF
jgi:hypothetical protein